MLRRQKELKKKKNTINTTSPERSKNRNSLLKVNTIVVMKEYGILRIKQYI
jgi:hypothetical protein